MQKNRICKLTVSLKIACCYFILLGTTSLIMFFVGFETYLDALSNKSLGSVMGFLLREPILDVFFLITGIGLFFRKRWAFKFSIFTIVLSIIPSTVNFAVGYTQGKPPTIPIYTISAVIVLLWNTVWLFLLCKKSSRDALSKQN